MVPYLALLAMSIVAVEAAFVLPWQGIFESLPKLMEKLGKTVSSKHISDHWKEKILPKYALTLARLSLSLGFYIIVWFALSLAVYLLVFWMLGDISGALDLLYQPLYLVILIVMSLVYLFLRRRVKK